MGNAFAQTSVAVHFCWLTAHMYEDQISTGVIAVTHNPAVCLFCLAALNGGKCICPSSIAVHFCWLTAYLYEDQISIGVIAVTHKPVVYLFCLAALNSGKCICPYQHCSAFLLAHCMPVRRSNLHRCDCSDTQPCCEPVLPSSTEMWEIHLPRPAFQCISVGSLHTCMKSKSLQV